MKNIKRITKRLYEVQGSVFETNEEGQLLSTTTTDYLENGEPALDTYFQEDCGMGHETRYEHGKPVSQRGYLFTDYVYDDEGRLVSSTTDTGAGFGIINRYQYNDDGSWPSMNITIMALVRVRSATSDTTRMAISSTNGAMQTSLQVKAPTISTMSTTATTASSVGKAYSMANTMLPDITTTNKDNAFGC